MDNIETRLIISAIHKIRPDAGFSIDKDYESLQWLCEDQEKPTEQEFNNAVEIEKAEYDAKQYQRDRNYPNIGEQLDLLYHDMTSGKNDKTGEWYKAISKVKTDNPKSS